ncbi:RNA polymerase sigma factor [Methylocapsa aurea]|uniref:RNA polymerase sigma factor n=1 Tax=Methylocapsa aurea TaxID=663610 RepID=UPI0005692FAD|nr:sigma-70 family RNA polymerase sigma factor [Methylocapsa aurea]
MTSWATTIGKLFVLHRAKLESIVMRRVRDREAAADVVQDVFLRMLEAGGAGSAEADTRVIYAATRNAAIDRGMMTARRARLLAALPPDQIAPAPTSSGANLESKQAIAALDQALAELSPRSREIFIEHRVHGVPIAAIAARLGISVSAVEKHLVRALRHCQSRLAAHLGRD